MTPAAAVLHPTVKPFANPAALAPAYQDRTIVPLPSNAAALGLVIDPAMGTGAKAVGAPRSLYRGLRPVALRLMIELAAQVRRVSGLRDAPLRIQSTVTDARLAGQAGRVGPTGADRLGVLSGAPIRRPGAGGGVSGNAGSPAVAQPHRLGARARRHPHHRGLRRGVLAAPRLTSF